MGSTRESGMEEEFEVASSTSVATNTFVTEIARYFKVFLDTNLQRGLLPARQVSLQRRRGLTAQLYLDAYPQLNKNLYKNFTSGFAQEAFVISQNKYVTHVDERVSDVLGRSIEALDPSAVEAFVRTLAHTGDKLLIEVSDDEDRYIDQVLTASKGLLASELVVPMLHELSMGGEEGDEVLLRNLTVGVTEKLHAALLPAIQSLHRTHYKTHQSPDILRRSLEEAIGLQAVQLSLREYLDELNVSDAYQQIYQLHLGNQALASTSLYLYFCEVSVGKYTFPLFYTPVYTSHTYPSISCSFDNRVFVNTKALEFVLQEHNRTIGYEEAFSGEIEQLKHVDPKNRKQVLPWLQRVVDILSETFGFDESLHLDSAGDQTVGNLSVTLNNRLQLSIFDANNEPTAADYDDILDGGSKNNQAFVDLVNSYVMKEPTRYVQAVAEDWREKSIVDKLLPINPLPLNDEQKQVMWAINKPECQVTVINGASGTGKTHLASAIVAQSFVSGYTSLVLSDTQASRDELGAAINKVLYSARDATTFHKALLRLDRPEDEYLDEIEAQFIGKLHRYNEIYAELQSELRTAKNRKVKEAVETLNTLTQNAENVNLHEVEQIINNEAKFTGRDWIQDEPIEELNSELQRLHQAVQYIRRSDANYLLPYIESSQQKVIADFLGALRDYERINKSVHQRLPQFILRYRKLLPDQKSRLQSALAYIHSNYRQFVKELGNDDITKRLEITDNSDFETIAAQQTLLNKLVDLGKESVQLLPKEKGRAPAMLDEMIRYEAPPEEVVSAISNYIEQVESLKSKLFGFSGRTLVVENLTRQLKKSVPQFNVKEPERKLDELQQMVDLVEFIIEQLASKGIDLKHWKEVLFILSADNSRIRELQKIIASLVGPAGFEFMAKHKIYEADNLLANISLLQQASELNNVFKNNPELSTLFGIKNIGQVLTQPRAYSGRFNKLATDLEEVKQLDESKHTIKQFIKAYPAAGRRLGINFVNGKLDVIDDTFVESSTDEIKEYLNFKKKEQDITSYFKEMTADNYGRNIHDLQQMTATQITHTLDSKLVEYIETHAADFNEIKTAIRAKQRLTPSQFRSLQQAFPCTVASIKDYAAFIPLQKDLFDVVIIDEASNVNVAEALPALLRAKKIVVLGDAAQHENTKSRTVNHRLNDMFRTRIVASLMRSIEDVPADTKNIYLTKLRNNFDVSNSILEFCRFIANAELTLTNYFRSPPEIISYSDKHFYKDTLKCLKARALPLNETIKIDQMSDSNIASAGAHTNQVEADYIMATLSDLKDAGFEGTIGIITPYFEQAVLLQKEIDESVINDWFERRKLKIMTFDTAHGEVRDYVLYSMVATADNDQLHYLFPDELTDTSTHEARRLNVGFSRAGEVAHFILSKPVHNYTGASGAALQHFQSVLAAGGVKTSASTSEILLDAESLLPQYFYATKFYNKYTDKVRLITHFSFGDYLRALSPKYKHPSYKVDFLVALGDERIIITYDEFKERFMANEVKEAANYLTANDIYNQKLIEGYGYKILRLNKFNLGAKPVDTLDRLLSEAVKKRSWPRDNGFLP